MTDIGIMLISGIPSDNIRVCKLPIFQLVAIVAGLKLKKNKKKILFLIEVSNHGCCDNIFIQIYKWVGMLTVE